MQSEIEIFNALMRIEAKLDSLMEQPRVQDYYSVAEFADRLKDKTPFTIREWCLLHRINASKRRCGRGTSQVE